MKNSVFDTGTPLFYFILIGYEKTASRNDESAASYSC